MVANPGPRGHPPPGGIADRNQGHGNSQARSPDRAANHNSARSAAIAPTANGGHKADLVRFKDISCAAFDDRSPANARLGHGRAARMEYDFEYRCPFRHAVALVSEEARSRPPVLGLGCQASPGTGQRSALAHCRVKPYWVKAAPLRGAAPGDALHRACGPDGPTRRSAPGMCSSLHDACR